MRSKPSRLQGKRPLMAQSCRVADPKPNLVVFNRYCANIVSRLISIYAPCVNVRVSARACIALLIVGNIDA
jgi:hypothetical protein